jgi:hypothetical protein
LGTGSIIFSQPFPANVIGLGATVIQAVSAGDYMTCALSTTGGVKCWGYNGEGELGDGTTTTRAVAGDVSGLTSGVVALASGDAHTCALTTAGGVKCWGHGQYGQLGNGLTVNRLTPMDVPGLTSGVSAITAGYQHTCAVTSAGGVKCWGWNRYGQLGNGVASDTPSLSPIDVPGLSGVTALTAGSNWTCALTTAGGVKCWGLNGAGQLGDGTTTMRLSPVNVVGLSSGVIGIAAAANPSLDGHTCALTQSNQVWCWGLNDHGQLGDGTRVTRLTPVQVSGSYGPPDTFPPTITGSAVPGPNANGWNNTQVMVSFTCLDSGSGIASCSAPTVLFTEGGSQSVTGTAVDNAGNSASATVGPINIDLTPPSIAGIATTAPNAAGWYRGEVDVHWTCSDALSGLDGPCPADSTVTGEGSSLSATASVFDRAGNQAAGTVSPIAIDRTAPITTASAPSGWSHADVTVDLAASDNLSGVEVTRYVLDGGPEGTGTSVLIDSEGTHTLSFWSVDRASNEEAHQTIEILVDETGPSITHTLAPAANGNGWNRTDVTVTWLCSDELSGIASCSDEETLTDEGASQQVTGTATDQAGNSATDVATVSIDRTAPTISGAPATAPNAAGWYREPVSVAFVCSDTLSGVASCPAPIALSSEGAGQQTLGEARDAADNLASAQVTGIDIDLTAPTATITTPADGATYALGQSVSAVYGCSDALSGMASCSGTVPPGSAIDTATPGTKSFSVAATDKAGNLTTTIVTYSVQGATSQSTTTVVTSSANPSVLHGEVTFTAQVAAAAGMPTGSVQWSVDGSNVEDPVALDSDGRARLVISTLTLTGGTPHQVSAVYTGAPGFDGSSGTIAQAVGYATTGTCVGSPGHAILQPVDADGSSVFKAKSTVVAKFRVCDALDASIGTPGMVTSFRLTEKVLGTVVDHVDEAVNSNTPDATFRWDPAGQQWVFNISTKGMAVGYTYIYTIALNDGSTIVFQFGLR